jgi:hypothetical protein
MERVLWVERRVKLVSTLLRKFKPRFHVSLVYVCILTDPFSFTPAPPEDAAAAPPPPAEAAPPAMPAPPAEAPANATAAHMM